MNFDVKHFVRWGIPGWVFLFIITIYFSIVDFDFISLILFSKSAPVIVAVLSLFIIAGIILGNMIHQISMCFGFVIWTKRNKYFREEYELDRKIMRLDNGKEIQRIYSYRLGNIHALRALWFSLSIALLILIILSLLWKFSFHVGVLMTIVFVLNIIVMINWRYFQANLNYFLKQIKNDFY